MGTAGSTLVSATDLATRVTSWHTNRFVHSLGQGGKGGQLRAARALVAFAALVAACAGCAAHGRRVDDSQLGGNAFVYLWFPTDRVFPSVVTALENDGYEMKSINRQVGSVFARRDRPISNEEPSGSDNVVTQVSVVVVEASKDDREKMQIPTHVEHVSKVTPTFNVAITRPDGSSASNEECLAAARSERGRFYKNVIKVLVPNPAVQ